jgi:tripartite-type tricarboxylate transporter receptor subunit TctC
VVLAMQRGEVEGLCASLGQFRGAEQLFRDGTFRVLFRAEESEIPSIPNAPSIFDLAKDDDQRRLMRFVFSSTEFGRPYVFPPDVRPPLVQFMRKVLAEAAHDPELIAEAEKMKLDMSYRSPETLEQLVGKLYKTPPEMIEAIKKIVPSSAL